MKLSRLRWFILEASWDKSFGAEILANKQIKNWLAKYGINNPEFVGEGGNGYAYRDGDKIIKITTDSGEAKVSARLINKPIHKNLSRIYDVKEHGLQIVNKFGLNRTLYLIVQDAVDTNIGSDLGEAADNVGGFIDVYGVEPPYKPPFSKKKEFKTFDEMFAECLRYEGIEASSPIAGLMRQLFGIIQSVYESTGLNYVDVSRGNTGLGFDGNIKLFDYGLSEFR